MKSIDGATSKAGKTGAGLLVAMESTGEKVFSDANRLLCISLARNELLGLLSPLEFGDTEKFEAFLNCSEFVVCIKCSVLVIGVFIKSFEVVVCSDIC